MQIILQAIKHTPLWVYILLIYLTWVGIKALKPNTVSLNKLFVLPLVFSVLSINSLVADGVLDFAYTRVYLGSLFLGIILGWVIVKSMTVEYDKYKNLIKRPGSKITLLLVLFMFSTKYFYKYNLTIESSITQSYFFKNSMLIAYGICTGIFLGRLACYLYKAQRQEHIDL